MEKVGWMAWEVIETKLRVLIRVGEACVTVDGDDTLSGCKGQRVGVCVFECVSECVCVREGVCGCVHIACVHVCVCACVCM